MEKKELITGNDLSLMMERLEIGINVMAWYWGIDRNTIGNYKRLGKKPLPKQKQFKILIRDLESNIEQVKAEFEETKQQ